MGLIEENSGYLMGTYKRKILLERGKGSYVFDEKGKKYLDLVGGVATCSVGHANQKVVKAIGEQAGKIVTPSNLFHSETQLKLAKKLAELSGLEKCFFCNSGTEAMEAAIKLAIKHSGKEKMIAMRNSFHGRTMGGLSATWDPKYKKGFGKLLQGFEHVEFGNIKALEEKIDDETAAVILEPIQGEAGIIVPKEGYLREVEKLCGGKGVLLIVDEVQSGSGRTGKFFCFQHEGIKPDIVAIAKGIGNGLPIGAIISKKGIEFGRGEHGSTFGGNSLCCAGALKTIEIIEKEMLLAEEKGDYFKKKLEEISAVKEVRGRGLMLAAEIEGNAEEVAEKCAEKGLLVNAMHGNVLRFLPALTIGMEELDLAAEIIKDVLGGEND